MPPKDASKDKKSKEKAEKAAATSGLERQALEIDEDRARQNVELLQRVDYLEITNEFYRKLMHPSSNLLVRRSEHEELRLIMEVEVSAVNARFKEAQCKFLQVDHAHRELAVELVHFRRQCRSMAASIHDSTVKIQSNVDAQLSLCVRDLKDQIFRRRNDVSESGLLLNRCLEDNMASVIRLTEETLSYALGITTLLQQNQKPMHTNIPTRIRRQLEKLTLEDLMLILDTLSFEEGSLCYLLRRFPPPADNPFAETMVYH